MENSAVENFRRYLRINTVQPNPDYDGAFEFLKGQAEEIGLQFKSIKTNDKPVREIIIITWEGTQPELPSLLLNSHIDVVPVFPDHWKYEPFSAFKDEKGNIYARGSQDMKCVGIQYLEAIRRLKNDGKKFSRTIHITFVPDEEIGGVLGMMKFVDDMDGLKMLNVGFALDEGLANPNEEYTVFYGERSPWWVRVRVNGQPGHGSRFIENNAAEKLRRVINSFLEYRDKQESKLISNPKLKLGDVTTLNITQIEGGVQPNVVPDSFSAVFDVRLTPTLNEIEFEQTMKDWCQKAGQNVNIEFLQKFEGGKITHISDDNPWWKSFSNSCRELGMIIDPEIFPAATDSRYIRRAGYPAIGFSPINNTPILLHDHNEFLNEAVFLRGIDIYYKIIADLASLIF